MSSTELDRTLSWYRDDYTVYHKDIDCNQDFRVTALLSMCQETAWNHAKFLKIDYSQEAFKNVHWVLSRMRVDLVGDCPLWMDKVQLFTSPSGFERLFAKRDFVARRGDGEVFALVTSSWVIIDAETRRIRRPEGILSIDDYHPEPSVLPEGAEKLPECLTVSRSQPVRAAWSDVDGHRHVNNVRYADWCLDSYPFERFITHRVSKLEMNFLSEILANEELECHSDSVSGQSNLHAVIKTADGTSAALLRVHWKEKEGSR